MILGENTRNPHRRANAKDEQTSLPYKKQKSKDKETYEHLLGPSHRWEVPRFSEHQFREQSVDPLCMVIQRHSGARRQPIFFSQQILEQAMRKSSTTSVTQRKKKQSLTKDSHQATSIKTKVDKQFTSRTSTLWTKHKQETQGLPTL